jgi:hypothetical protein
MLIGISVGLGLGVGIPERLVLGDGADLRADRGHGRRRGEGATLEDAFDRGVGEAIGGEQPRAHRLDVGAGVSARELGEAVDRPLAGAAQAGEQFTGERGGVGGLAARET